MISTRPSRGRWAAASVLLALLSISAPAAAKTVYVDGVHGQDSWNGLCESFDGGTCGPKATIQAGINAADSGDEVVVADAIYTGTGNLDLRLHGKVITLRSAAGPQDCIIDCDYSDARSFDLQDDEGPDTVIDGFTIMNAAPC